MSATAPTLDPSTTTHSDTNSTVRRCLDAWSRRFQLERDKGTDEYYHQRFAAASYRAAMPELASPSDIRDFIACTARGILIGAIDEKIGAKLLYAAQVASGNLYREAKPEKAKTENPA